MGRPKTLTNRVIGFILENHEQMKTSEMAMRLNVKEGTIRCFLAMQGLSAKHRKSYYERDVATGCFDVDSMVDWLTGRSKK